MILICMQGVLSNGNAFSNGTYYRPVFRKFTYVTIDKVETRCAVIDVFETDYHIDKGNKINGVKYKNAISQKLPLHTIKQFQGNDLEETIDLSMAHAAMAALKADHPESNFELIQVYEHRAEGK